MGRDALGRFKAGEPSCLTQEERARKARAVSETWKSNPNYIGDIKDECPRIYNSWRGIRFTRRGKEAGCCPEWENFRTFYNDVRPSYEKGLILRRKDVILPWGPQNFMWITSEEAGAVRSSVMIEYQGRELSLVQWANELGLSRGTLRIRYYRHLKDWTIEEILFGKKKNRNAKVAKDITDPSVSIRAKASKMISSYRNTDRANGTELCDIDIDWMIENILTKPCVYCGDTRRIGCDRIDNSKGHTKDNVVPCCIECNSARNNFFTYEEMKRLGRVIAEIKKDRKK